MCWCNPRLRIMQCGKLDCVPPQVKIEDLQAEIARLTALNKAMHDQVAGYLKGEDWQHWQEFNQDKFKA